jgi:hypothetical protein
MQHDRFGGNVRAIADSYLTNYPITRWLVGCPLANRESRSCRILLGRSMRYLHETMAASGRNRNPVDRCAHLQRGGDVTRVNPRRRWGAVSRGSWIGDTQRGPRPGRVPCHRNGYLASVDVRQSTASTSIFTGCTRQSELRVISSPRRKLPRIDQESLG